ncbi:MAG: hypothetical protein V1494_00995 [Candidatus Diapherotrites archaeon]
MDLSSDAFLRAKILFRLARKRKWGHSHTAFDNLKMGFKPREHGKVKELAETLIKEGLILRKPTGYGLHVSLNHERAQEIKQIIKNMLGRLIE